MSLNSNLRLKWRRAARLWGLQLEYENAQGDVVSADHETLVDTLGVLSGHQVSDKNLDELVSKAREKKVLRMLEPCYVQKREGWISVSVFFQENLSQKEIRFGVRQENGDFDEVQPTFEVGHKIYKTTKGHYKRAIIQVRHDLPPGYHSFEFLKHNEVVAKTLLLVPPPQKNSSASKKWGLFSPVYSLHSQHSWGVGDLRDLAEVQAKVHAWGGDFVGTLPLLASPLDKKDAIYSPYSPVSKLFWNELFLDVPSILKDDFFAAFADRGQRLKHAIEKLNETDLISYQQVYELKKRLLMDLALHFFKNAVPEDYLDFVNKNPLLEEYAHFRAQGHPEERKYHLFVQFQLHKQLGKIKNLVDQKKLAGLYLDFPVGTNPDGFDNHYFKSIFLNGCSVGAPPDLLFKDGQNWGFSPPNALPMRERHYDYFRLCLKNHMQFAKILRMDHVMALKRLYIIPPGKAADKGIYLRYNSDELFTILAIEAHRHQVEVIGENLGTVPSTVQEAMAHHHFYGMWVLAFEAGRSPSRAIHKVPPKNLMCLNTHDMSPFAGYLAAQDLKSFIDIQILSEEDARTEMRKRKLLLSLWKKDLHEEDFGAFFAKITAMLAKSRGEMLLVNVEDLWAETQAQNIPGTLTEHPNWRRRLKYSLEEWTENPDFAAFLKDITTLRKGSLHVSADFPRSVSL